MGTDTPRGEVTGSVQRPPPNRIVSRPIPPIGGATEGVSGGGSGMASYRPDTSAPYRPDASAPYRPEGREVTGSVRPVAPPPPPPPQRWSWEGGTPITVGHGETLETIARRHGVPVAAIMQANHITSAAMVHPGEHLVIPRVEGTLGAGRLPASRTALAPPPPSLEHTVPPRLALGAGGETHVVAPGETLHSIARAYHKSPLLIAKANNITPDTMLRVGQRITIPGQKAEQHADAPAPAPLGRTAANTESHSAWNATPAAQPAQQQSPVKSAEAVGSLPTFRWPVRGRIIAGFGPTPSGAQNDGIDVAVPQGTPIKAAEDGVVAYAGNELKGYGNLVLVRHGDGYVTAYAHASEILVKRGETVKRGQVIARSGSTGSVKSPELHFEIRKGATPVDPGQFLNGA